MHSTMEPDELPFEKLSLDEKQPDLVSPRQAVGRGAVRKQYLFNGTTKAENASSSSFVEPQTPPAESVGRNNLMHEMVTPQNRCNGKRQNNIPWPNMGTFYRGPINKQYKGWRARMHRYSTFGRGTYMPSTPPPPPSSPVFLPSDDLEDEHKGRQKPYPILRRGAPAANIGLNKETIAKLKKFNLLKRDQ